MTLSKAFSLLYGDTSPILLQDYRPTALAVLGFGFTLFFLQLSVRVFQISEQKRVLSITVVLIPVFFIGGQLIGMWISEKTPSILTESAKQQVVKASFYRLKGLHNSFFPYLFESKSRVHKVSAKQGKDYVLSIPDEKYSTIIRKSSDVLKSMYFRYLNDAPSKTEWYFAKRLMSQEIHKRSGNLINKDIKKTLMYRPQNIFSPFWGEWEDAILLSMVPDMTLSSHSAIRTKLRGFRYGFVIGKPGMGFLDNDNLINMQIAVRDVLGIDRTVPENKRSVRGSNIEHLIWTKQLEELIPEKGFVTAIPFGLSSDDFFYHRSVAEIIESQMPYFYYDNQQLIELDRFSSTEKMRKFKKQLSPLDADLKNRSSILWGKSIAEKVDVTHAFELKWYKTVMSPHLTIGFSVPLIVFISSALFLGNIYQFLLITGATKRSALFTVLGLLLIILILPLNWLSISLNDSFEAYLPWLGEWMHYIGLKQDTINT